MLRLHIRVHTYVSEVHIPNKSGDAIARLIYCPKGKYPMASHASGFLIFHQRSPGERDAFLDVIKAHSPDEKEVEIMAQTAAEALIQQGKAEGIVEGIVEGIEQGARQTSIQSTLTILNGRFPEADVPALKPMLEAIEDLDRLKQVNLEASLAASFQSFRDRLSA